jgi:hypothetical protein
METRNKEVSMSTERLFTSEELEEMGRLTRDLIKKAIEEGDLDRAKKLTDRMYREFLSMHDLYLYWLTATLTFVGRNHGDKVLYEALKEGCNAWVSPLTESYTKKDVKAKIAMLAAGLRGHLHPFKIEEDDEKFTITYETCPSGGRLIADRAYDPPLNFLKIERSQPMTYEQDNFPVYCAHCLFQTLIPIEAGLTPFLVTEPASDLEKGQCRVFLYKDPAAIPDDVFEQVRLTMNEFEEGTSSRK